MQDFTGVQEQDFDHNTVNRKKAKDDPLQGRVQRSKVSGLSQLNTEERKHLTHSCNTRRSTGSSHFLKSAAHIADSALPYPFVNS